ncbi:MAG: S41 family peptidase [Phycisphaerales bacterium]|nr:S41 family peptidase [Phycisphaerales bacterium]
MKNGRVLFEVSLAVGFGVVLGATGLALTLDNKPNNYAFLDPIITIKSQLDKTYVDVPDDKVLQAGAIKGMLDSLNDPYTVYVPPADRQEFNKSLTGEYVGIGASVNTDKGWLVIVSPLEDSPAFKAGLMAEDKVLEIDGKSTQGLSVDDCINLLQGTPGTSVTLLIERGSQKLTIPITRDRIKTRSVKGFHRDATDANKWEYVIDPSRGIAYVRLSQFTPQVSQELAAALVAAGAPEGKLKGLVLDLRWNPGGLLNEAENIADMFLKDGIIVSTKGRAYADEVARAHSEGTLPDFPIAIIVNGQSASASEVLSGALVDNNRAIVVGTRSFGKGLVQNVYQVDNTEGGELKITEQRYYLPSGRSIQRKDDSQEWGVDPTPGFFVPMTDDELVELIKVRRQVDVMRADAARDAAERWSDPDWILGYLKDKQLAAAVKAVQLRVDAGQWLPTGEEGAKSTIAGGELKKLTDTRDAIERELVRLDKRIASLENAATPVPPVDLWGDDVNVAGGRVQVFDKDGKLVTTLSLPPIAPEQGLIDAGLKPQSTTPEQPPAKPEPQK